MTEQKKVEREGAGAAETSRIAAEEVADRRAAFIVATKTGYRLAA
jgi:hypothetical protein